MEGNQVRIAIREEGSTDNWKILRRTNDSLSDSPETTRSEEIRSDRLRSGQKVTSISVGGSVSVEFSAKSFDEILEGTMMTTWEMDTPTAGTNQLTIGTTTKRYEVLKSFLDVDKHVLFKGMEVGHLSLSMSAGSRITGEITFAGTEADKEYDPSTDTFDDTLTTQIMDSSNNLGTITIDGSPAGDMVINDLSLSINNNHQQSQALGSVFQDNFKGSADVTGSVTVQANASAFALRENSITNTPIGLGYELNDQAGNTYGFQLDKAFLSGDLPSGGLDERLTFELDLVGAVGDASGKVLTITNTPAA